MQIMIEIPEGKYKSIVEKYNTFPSEMKEWGLDAIKNGTPLPKGHGKIIDADTIHIVDENFYTKSDYYEAIGAINDAPTIIEADSKYEAKAITRGNCMMCGK